MRTRHVLIVYRPSPGLRQDGLVLAEALRRSTAAIVVHRLELQVSRHDAGDQAIDVSALRDHPPLDCIFMLEKPHANFPLLDSGFARRVVLVPNPEWLLPPDVAVLRSGRIEGLLLKNRYARERLDAAGVSGLVRYADCVGWTSLEPADAACPPTGHAHRFLHVCGLSTQKNPDLVLQTWRLNPDFPALSLVRWNPDDLAAPPTPHRIAPNVTLYPGVLSATALADLQASHGVHVYPSLAEGFGHVLNEARSRGKVLITTDAPPMHDLVVDGVSGFVVPHDPRLTRRLHLAFAFPVSPAALEAVVRRVLALNPAALAAIASRGRDAYCLDRAAFHTAFRAFWHRRCGG